MDKEVTKLQNAAYNSAWAKLRDKYREEYDELVNKEFAARGLERKRRLSGEEREKRDNAEKMQKAQTALDKLLAENPELKEYARTIL